MRLTLTITLAAFLLSLFAFGQETSGQTPDAARFATLLTRAQAGDREAERLVAMAYEEGKGIEQDFVEAAKWYQKAAEGGDPAAQNNLAVMYQMGNGVPKSPTKAVEWYRKAAHNGYPPSLFNLGIAYFNGNIFPGDVLPYDPVQAYALVSLAAEGGDDAAKAALVHIRSEISQCEEIAAWVGIGMAYEDGFIPANDAKAALWLTKGAEAGNPLAQVTLSALYHDGRGVTKDLKAAEYWKDKALKQNFAPAMFKVAEMYHTGRGIEKDPKRALTWYEKAVQYGEMRASYALGKMYAQGVDVPQDYSKAHALLYNAKLNKIPGAEEELKALEPKMDAKQMKAAEKQSSELARKQKRSTQKTSCSSQKGT